MKRRIVFLFAVLAISMAALAQTPVKWRLSVNMSSQTEGEVVLRAVVEPGWHLYSTQLPDGGPKPTQITFDAPGVKFKGNIRANRKLITKDDHMFGLKLSWWDGNVEFRRKFKIENAAQATRIGVTVSFMACNDENCMPPKTETLTYTFSK